MAAWPERSMAITCDAKLFRTSPSALHSQQYIEILQASCQKLRQASSGKAHFRTQSQLILNRALGVQMAAETALVSQLPQMLEPQLSRVCLCASRLLERALEWVDKYGNLPWMRYGLGIRGRRVCKVIELIMAQLEDCASDLASTGRAPNLDAAVGEVDKFMRLHIDYRIPDWVAQVSQPVTKPRINRMRTRHRIRRGSKMWRRRMRSLLFVGAGEEAGDGRVWWWVDGALQMYDVLHSSTSPVPTSATLPAISAMMHDRLRGCIWTGHVNGTIFVWNARSMEAQAVHARAFKSAAVNALTLDDEGRVWAGSNSGNMRVLQASVAEAGSGCGSASCTGAVAGAQRGAAGGAACAPGEGEDPGSCGSCCAGRPVHITHLRVVHNLVRSKRRGSHPLDVDPAAVFSASCRDAPYSPCTASPALQSARTGEVEELVQLQSSAADSDMTRQSSALRKEGSCVSSQAALGDDHASSSVDTVDTMSNHLSEMYPDHANNWSYKNSIPCQAKEWMTAHHHRAHSGPVWTLLSHEQWVFSTGGRCSYTARIAVWDTHGLRLVHEVQTGRLGPSRCLAIMPWRQGPSGRQKRKGSEPKSMCSPSWRLLSGHDSGSMLMWAMCSASGLTPMLRINVIDNSVCPSAIRGMVVMSSLNLIAVGTREGKLVLLNMPAYKAGQPGLDGRVPASLDKPHPGAASKLAPSETSFRIKPQQVTVMVPKVVVADAHSSQLLFCTGGDATLVTAGAHGSVVLWPEEELWHLGKGGRLVMPPLPKRTLPTSEQVLALALPPVPQPLEQPDLRTVESAPQARLEDVHTIVHKAVREALFAKKKACSLQDDTTSEPGPTCDSPLGSRANSHVHAASSIPPEGGSTGNAHYCSDEAAVTFATDLTAKIVHLIGRRGSKGTDVSGSLLPGPQRSVSDADLRHASMPFEDGMRRIGRTGGASSAASVATADADVDGVITRLSCEGVRPPTSAGSPTDDMLSLLAGTGRSRSMERDDSGGTTSTRSKTEASYRRGWEDLIVEMDDLVEIRAIGSGSYGEVTLSQLHGSSVAVKKLKAAHEAFARGASQRLSSRIIGLTADLAVDSDSDGEDSGGSTVLDELGKEVEIMKSIRHPNVVLFMGVVLDPPAIITEYCQRGSLFDVIRRARSSRDNLPWFRCLSMAADAARGMLALHAHKPQAVVHRDLKSPNLLVTDSWKVKVCDFNLSRFLSTASSVVLSKNAADNPTWQAPEVIEKQEYGFKGDVYAYGIVLWELLTLEQPWRELSNFQVAVAVVNKDERPAIPQLDALPGGRLEGVEEYVDLMQACWAKDPEQRPSFRSILTRLDELFKRVQRRRGQRRHAAAAAELRLDPIESQPGPADPPLRNDVDLLLGDLPSGGASELPAAAAAPPAPGVPAALGSPFGAAPEQQLQPQASPFGAAAVQEPQPQLQTSPFGAVSAQEPQPQASPFGTATAQQLQPQASPFGAATAQQPQLQASPFGAASAQEPQLQASPFGAAPAYYQQTQEQQQGSPLGAASGQQQSQTLQSASPFAAAASGKSSAETCTPPEALHTAPEPEHSPFSAWQDPGEEEASRPVSNAAEEEDVQGIVTSPLPLQAADTTEAAEQHAASPDGALGSGVAQPAAAVYSPAPSEGSAAGAAVMRQPVSYASGSSSLAAQQHAPGTIPRSGCGHGGAGISGEEWRFCGSLSGAGLSRISEEVCRSHSGSGGADCWAVGGCSRVGGTPLAAGKLEKTGSSGSSSAAEVPPHLQDSPFWEPVEAPTCAYGAGKGKAAAPPPRHRLLSARDSASERSSLQVQSQRRTLPEQPAAANGGSDTAALVFSKRKGLHDSAMLSGWHSSGGTSALLEEEETRAA